MNPTRYNLQDPKLRKAFEDSLDLGKPPVEPSHAEVFQKKLRDLARAAQELNDAWDMVDGDKAVMSKFDIRWPFQENLYYLALGDLKKWCTNTAKNLDK